MQTPWLASITMIGRSQNVGRWRPLAQFSTMRCEPGATAGGRCLSKVHARALAPAEITVGEDKAYDTNDHVAALRPIGVTPYVAHNDTATKTGKPRKSAIDARTTRHAGYAISQTCRKMVECIFGWGKQHGTMRKVKHRGLASVGADFLLNRIGYNLIGIPRLIGA
jgi:Transposase DDE domain